MEDVDAQVEGVAAEQDAMQTGISLEDRVRAAIRAALPEWIMSKIHSSPVARHTDAYNHLTQSLASLEEAIVRKL